MFFSYLENVPGRIGCLAADFMNPADKELQPSFPIAVVTNRHQAVIVGAAVLFEVVAQVEQRSFERTFLAQQKSDKQSSDSSVTVKKRMDGLKLCVRQAALNEQR